MKVLVVIPARGGSKGLPKKNIKVLNGKPLINYSIEIAQQVFDNEDICVSTDSEEIAEIAKKTGIEIPFLRPDSLSLDTSTSQEVLIHCIEFFQEKGINYDAILLLQPTSPFRKKEFLEEIIAQYSPELDMVVSVKETESNPYYILVEENENGFLEKSKEAHFTRRQDCPKVYEYNGSMYMINVKSLLEKPMSEFKKVTKYVMDSMHSIDIDNQLDFDYATFLIEKGYLK